MCKVLKGMELGVVANLYEQGPVETTRIRAHREDTEQTNFAEERHERVMRSFDYREPCA